MCSVAFQRFHHFLEAKGVAIRKDDTRRMEEEVETRTISTCQKGQPCGESKGFFILGRKKL